MLITWVDVAVIGITLFSGILSLIRGFSREILSLFTWLCSAGLAFVFYKDLAEIFRNFIKSASITNILSLLIIFTISFLLLSYISVKISQLLGRSFIGPFDKFLGIIYGVARGVLIVAMVVFLTSNIVEDSSKKLWLTSAKTYPLLYSLGETIYSLIPENFLDLDKIFTTINEKTNNSEAKS